jgi:hypothetical protein
MQFSARATTAAGVHDPELFPPWPARYLFSFHVIFSLNSAFFFVNERQKTCLSMNLIQGFLHFCNERQKICLGLNLRQGFAKCSDAIIFIYLLSVVIVYVTIFVSIDAMFPIRFLPIFVLSEMISK